MCPASFIVSNVSRHELFVTCDVSYVHACRVSCRAESCLSCVTCHVSFVMCHMSRNVISCHIMSCHVVSCHVMSCSVLLSCHVSCVVCRICHVMCHVRTHSSSLDSSDDLEHQDRLLLTNTELRHHLLSGSFGEVKWTATAALALLHLETSVSIHELPCVLNCAETPEQQKLAEMSRIYNPYHQCTSRRDA